MKRITFALMVLGLSGCDSNKSGDLTATHFGDLSAHRRHRA
jgi:hypothetical protein